jgi:hypothetical protein
MYACILGMASWNASVLIDEFAWEELNVLKHLRELNGSALEKKDTYDIVVYSDASA